MSSSVHDRLRYPAQLGDDAPSLEALKGQVDAKLDQQQDDRESGENKKDPKRERRYSFPFSFVASSGDVYSGGFTSVVLSIRDQVRAGVLTAELLGGSPIESVPMRARNLAVMLGILTYALDGDRPGWAKDLLKLDNYALVTALFGEVVAHHSTFHGDAFTAEP